MDWEDGVLIPRLRSNPAAGTEATLLGEAKAVRLSSNFWGNFLFVEGVKPFLFFVSL